MGLAALALTACSDDDPTPQPGGNGSGEWGASNDVFSEAEWLPGGELGTTKNSSASAYEDPTPAVEQAGMEDKFKYGEYFFERPFNLSTPPFGGLGPMYVRSSCIDCHPGYGHGKRVDSYKAEYGNGYLLVVFNRETEAYVSELTGMPQTRAASPFLPPVEEEGIKIQWLPIQDEWGNKFPDGETYDLIYPEVTIDPNAINTDPKPTNYEVRLESTIGIYGTGLLDAIPDDSLLAQYQTEAAAGAKLNPAIFNGTGWAKTIAEIDGTAHPGRFTYGLSRGTLQNGPGANAIWNITNVSRSDRRTFYTTPAYAKAMSENKEVISAIMQKGKDPESWLHPFYGETEEETAQRVLTALSMNDPYNKKGSFDVFQQMGFTDEMSDEDYINFMIWHRGLAVPAARNLHDDQVKKGKQLFYDLGCTSCHRPSWTTGSDDYSGDPMVKGKLPKYPNQTIWPYSDMVQHRLYMKNDIRTGWCRTTPLWGRGLSLICTGASDRLHDMRARNEIEAIMWHGYSQESDARWAVEKFRELSKEDRDAIVKFIQSI